MAGDSSAPPTSSEVTPKPSKKSSFTSASKPPSHSHSTSGVLQLADDLKDKVSSFVLQELILEVTLESVFELDRLGKKEKSSCGACGLQCRSFNLKAGKDIYGRDLNTLVAERCECLECGNEYSCARYAPHLEKCLGMGRNARPKKSLLE